MKQDSFRNNRKALVALLFCTGFISVMPNSVYAEGSSAIVQATQQQKTSVSGVIKDSTGEPVIGASVVEKGTTNGTITDLDGKYTLRVAPGATLVVSYIGYKAQEIKVAQRKQIDVTLAEDTEVLEEVLS